MKILYATSNPYKIESANRNLSSFNITVEGIKVDGIQEIQTDSIEEISIDKAKKSYDKVGKPLIVSDGGWNIPALNGFPGPMMAYVNRWLSSEDFLNLMRDKQEKSIILTEYITYIDDSTIKSFKQVLKGHFLDHIEGEGTNVDRVITFREDSKSVAKCQNENVQSINQIDMWNELGEYLQNKNLD
jgi:XTP/dITP diphosphohydrolase